MGEDEQRLLEDARRNREETQEAREESGLGRTEEPDESPSDDIGDDPRDREPWAKTSGGDPDNLSDDA